MDLSGVAVAVAVADADADADAIIATDPASASAPAVGISAPTIADLSGVIAGILNDLGAVGVQGVGELVRYIPRLAAHVQMLPISKMEKRDLVVAAGHALVDRCVPEDARATAHGLVDSVFPFAIAAVIDVVRGRVQFGDPVQAVSQLTQDAPPVVQEVVGGCLPLLARLCAPKA